MKTAITRLELSTIHSFLSLDKNGVPVSTKSEHGLGTRSIVAFCEKAGAAYEFKTNDRKFSLRIVIE